MRFFGLVALFPTLVRQPLSYAKSSTLAACLFALRRLAVFACGLRMLFDVWLFGEEWGFSFGIDFANFGVGRAEMIDPTDIDLTR